MLNKEKYAKEIAEIACDGYKVAIVHGKPKSCGKCIDCDFYGCNDCTKKLRDWADNEYGKPPVDWSKIPVDTPILVRNEGVGKEAFCTVHRWKNICVAYWHNIVESWK